MPLRSFTLLGVLAITAGLIILMSAPPSFCAKKQDTTPSFFGWKELFYQYAPHMGKEDLNQKFSQEPGQDKAVTYSPQPKSDITSSGREPSATLPAPKTRAIAPLANQPPLTPFMQMEFTEYVNPLLNNFGPPTYYSIPFRHTMPDNPIPIGMNSQSFQDSPYLTGATPASDLVQHSIKLAASQRTAEKILDPSLPSARASYQGAAQQTADAATKDAAGSFDANMNASSNPLINIANEMAATPAQGYQQHRSISQAVWIVQQMYKRFFLPLGLLLLLVGAIATQTTTFVKYSFTDASESDSRRPFEGILRSIVAVFLIGAVQLIVSYFIDFGNAMTDPVTKAIDVPTLQSWSQQMTDPFVNLTPAQMDAYNKNESTAASTTRAIYGSVQALLNTALMVLGTYQLVMVCYLLLFGPIAAAMFAWPEGVGSLFRNVFTNWLNGLSNLVLWRFWWCVILLTMTTRVQWLKEIGSYNPTSPWEPIVYTAFLVMLTYVPFAALDFRPGDLVDSLLEKATLKK